MKTLKISNGEILNGYEFKDLSEIVKDKVVSENWTFLNSFESDPELELTDSDVIENLEANDYLFNEKGEVLPITWHMVDNKCVRMSYMNNRYEVTIVNKAILRKGETDTEHIKAGVKYDFFYGYGGDFYLLIDGLIHEEVSTAFDFVQ